MKTNLTSIRECLLDILFPKFCLSCGKEGKYLCDDCCALIDIAEYQYCPFCSPARIVLDGKTCKYCARQKNLTGLFCATSYKTALVKKMLHLFKYEPFVKDLAEPLYSLIISHFQILGKEPEVDFIIPIPLHKNKLKERGFNQAEELAKGIAQFLKKPVISNVLFKIKPTPAQMELSREEREKNIKNAFVCRKPEAISGRKILLVDDVFTTGATMEECARVLKDAGARQVWGAVVARG